MTAAHALPRKRTRTRVAGHVGKHHSIYRRALVLLTAIVCVVFVAHWLDVMFATVNVLHFLDVDDLLAKAGA